MTKRKTIAILFATGTVLSSLKSRSIVFVDSEGDMSKWLEAIPEIGLIASIEPHFMLSESATFGYDQTLELSAKIQELSTKVDGIVVLMRTENIVTQSALLNFLNQHLTIPVIMTGSVVSPQALTEGVLSDAFKKSVALSLKSNVINAVQVATRDFRGFGIMYGNRLIEPIRVQRDNVESLNIFSSIDGKYVGRVEFGISINQGKQSSTAVQLFSAFSRNIALYDSLLLTPEQLQDTMADVVIIKIRENEQLSDDLYMTARQLKQPVILYNYWYVLEHEGLATVSRVTESVLMAKCMWLLGQQLSKKEFEHKVAENTIGEILS